MFNYTENTIVTIDGKPHIIRMYDGCTGIGSREYWLDDKKRSNNIVTQSNDITVGNHELYRINWREQPWDVIDILIHEDEVPYLLDKEKQPSWRNPIKIKVIK
jgi:hypothetical protein